MSRKKWVITTLVVGVAFAGIASVLLVGSFMTPPVAVTPDRTIEQAATTAESPEKGLDSLLPQQSTEPTPEKSQEVASSDTAESAAGDQQPSVTAESFPEGQQLQNPVEPSQTVENTPQSVEQLASSNRQNVPVDFKQLKALLPASIAGMPRVDDRGRRTEIMGGVLSEYKGTYPTSSGGSITVSIVDVGGIHGAPSLPTFSWAASETPIDRRSETGYERTTTYQGHRAYEKYDAASPTSEIAVLVNGHCGVSLQGYHVTMKELQTVLDAIDLSKLAAVRS